MPASTPTAPGVGRRARRAAADGLTVEIRNPCRRVPPAARRSRAPASAHRARRAGRARRRAAGARPYADGRLPALGVAAVGGMTGPIRVLVVDDDPLVRAAWR